MKLDDLIQSREMQADSHRSRTAAETFVEFVKTPLAGIGVGIEQARADPSAERKKDEIARMLQQLELAHELLEKLRPPLQSAGFQILDQCRVLHPYKTSEHLYTGLQNGGDEIALIQLPAVVFIRTEGRAEPYVSDFAHMLKAFRDRPLRLLSENLQEATWSFRAAFADEKKGADWKIIQWSDVDDLCAGKLNVLEAFALSKPGPAANVPKTIGADQINSIVNLVGRYATLKPGSATDTYKELVSDCHWPQEWKDELLASWSIKPGGARSFVDYMVLMQTFPAGHELAGRSVLGDFLQTFVGKVGGDDRDLLARIVVDFALVPNADSFKKYYLNK